MKFALNFAAVAAQAQIHNILLGGSNDVDPLIPELWANESLVILEENMVAGMLVNRDFETTFARFGETVNTRRPAEFTAKRKTSADNVTVQDANTDNVPVVLNQHVHVSFLIKDGEESLAFKDLVEFHLKPAMLANAQFVDRVVLGQFHRFRANSCGGLEQMTAANAQSYILNARNVMNKNNAWPQGRNIIWTPDGETAALGTELFVSAEKRGDGGQALQEASMGRVLGFQHYMCQNMSSIGATDKTASVALINMAGGAAKGTTSLVTDNGAAAIPNNSFITIAGDYTPLRVVSTTGGSTPTAIVVESPGLRTAVADNAIITKIGVGTIESTTFAAGYSKEIGYSGFTIEPQVGQLVTFGTDPTSPVYVIVDADNTNNKVTLDRPLEAQVSSGAAMNLGPAGNYNFAFHKNALTLVTRPLAPPKSGTGAQSAVVSYNGLTIRATITYDGNKQGHLVTLDFLMGVALLDEDLGAVIYS